MVFVWWVAIRDAGEHADPLGRQVRQKCITRLRLDLRRCDVAEGAKGCWRAPRHLHRPLQIIWRGGVGDASRRGAWDYGEIDFLRDRQQACAEALAGRDGPRELVGQINVDGEITGVGDQGERS